MTRTHHPRADARRTVDGRRASSVRVAVPVLMAVLVIGSTATASLVSGLSLWLVAAITLAVALAGAVIARRAVASLFAGLSLLVIRPYAPGEQLRLHSHADDSVLDVEVVRIGLVNSTLATPSGLLVLPNASLLRGTF